MTIEPLHTRMSETERRKRGLLNGYRVTMAREARGHNRVWLSRRLGWEGTAQLRAREADWAFWTPEEMAALETALDFPLTFYAQDDPPAFFETGGFMCHVDPTGEESVCEIIPPRAPRPSPWRERLTRRERAGRKAR